MGAIVDKSADTLAEIGKTTIDIPHPGRPGMRIVGWVIPEKTINPGVSNLVLIEILKNWALNRRFGNR